MRWKGRQGSGNVEDRRGSGGGRSSFGGGAGKAGLGIGGVIIVIIVMLLGGDPSAILGGVSIDTQTENQASTSSETGQPTDDMGQFSSVVLKETEDVWNKIFKEEFNVDYPEPKLVLFSGVTNTACGRGESATGPFYCPADQDIYIDLTFFEELQNRFGAGGDFAAAYVIAHEVGHHIQNQRQIGTSNYVNSQRGKISKTAQNELSVRLELQADFYAGVWAHHADKWKGILEEGDIDEALNAANAIGDDRLQKQAQGYTVPESFTHGTSAQRKKWFLKGYQTGDISQGDTFKTNDL